MHRSHQWIVAAVLVSGTAQADPSPEVSASHEAAVSDAVEIEPARPLLGYDNGLRLQSPTGDYQLGISGRLQGRSTDDELGFRRARLSVKGSAQDLSFKFQGDFADGYELKDLYADYRIADGLRFRAGRFKRPSSRSHVGSSASLALVDRSMTHAAFRSERDTGLALHNDYKKSPRIEWVIGVFHSRAPGSVSSLPESSDDVPPMGRSGALVARVGYNHGDVDGYVEGDLTGGPLRMGVGLSNTVELDRSHGDRALTRTSVDYIAKLRGVSATGALFVATAQDDPEARLGQALDAVGGYQQVSYTILGRIEPALRLGFVDYRGTDPDEKEVTAGLAYYQLGHDLKLNTDATAILTRDAATQYQVRTQLQLVF